MPGRDFIVKTLGALSALKKSSVGPMGVAALSQE
jgi:hypothetical protein